MGTYNDLKLRTTLSLPGAKTYFHIVTIVPWSDTSGGPIYQTAYNGDDIYTRYSSSTSAWNSWIPAASGGADGATGATGPTGVTGPLGTSSEARLTISTVTGTSLTSGTSPSISNGTYSTYYNITNAAFNALTLPGSPDTGAFWVLRNNSPGYITFNPTYTTGSGPTTISIPPSTGITITWSGSAFVLF
jgi:hypothetical protein